MRPKFTLGFEIFDLSQQNSAEIYYCSARTGEFVNLLVVFNVEQIGP